MNESLLLPKKDFQFRRLRAGRLLSDDAPETTDHRGLTAGLRVETPWGRLREVVVGRIEGARVPFLEPKMLNVLPENQIGFFTHHAGLPFSEKLVRGASFELEGFCETLRSLGVNVQRPDAADFSKPVLGEGWSVPCGLYNAMPRDVILPVADKLIVAPMAWRCRQREIDSYLGILASMRTRGTQVIFPPRPKLNGTQEPTFDAADFAVIGREIYGQLSHVTNWQGVVWLSSVLGDEYTIHLLPVDDPHAMHIDATFVPLRHGLLLLNPERLSSGRLPRHLRHWKILTAPPPEIPDTLPLYFSSKWLSMNILVIDESTVIVSPREKALTRLLESQGFRVVHVMFDNFNAFGGSFHCATVEVARD